MRCGEFRTRYAADMAIFDGPVARWATVAFLLALLPLPLFASSYWLDVLNRCAIATVAAVGLNVLTGFTGQISLGNAAFLAIGAYATAGMAGRLGLPFLMTVPLSGLAAALAGMVFGVPSLRLKGLYLAMATLAAHFIVEFVAVHWESMTGGVNGISVAPAALGPLALDSDARLFYLNLPVAAFLVLFARNLFRTRAGKAFVAIRDQDVSAEVMGVRVFRYKLLAFAVSSFYVGVAGSLLAYQARIISPENFPITLAIDQLGMVIIGGLGSVQGSVFGAVFLTLLPELLRVLTGAVAGAFPQMTQLFASLRMGLFGLVIVLFLVFEPDGLAARWRSIKAYWKLYPFSY
jgi:branched-chain amino acid transport system permease protein